MQLLHNSGAGGLGVETVYDGVVVELGLLYRQLGLLQSGLGAAGIDAVEDVALFHLVAHLEGGLQNLAGDHAADVVGVDGLDGAGAGDGYGHLLHLGSAGQVGARQQFFSCTQHGPDDEEEQGGQHQEHRDDHFRPAALFLGCFPGRGAVLLGSIRDDGDLGSGLQLFFCFHCSELLAVC